MQRGNGEMASRIRALVLFAFLTTGSTLWAGSISGTVTDGVTGLSGFLNVYNASGQFVQQTTTSGPAGSYTFTGLADGTYFLKTMQIYKGGDKYVDELYNNIQCTMSACAPTNGTPIVLSGGGAISGIDFVLQIAGSIKGTVTDGVTGMGGIIVNVYAADGTPLSNRATSASGDYAIGGLPSGTYFLRTINNSGLTDELYDNQPCPNGACTITSGTPITVVAPATTTNINFALSSGGGLSGRLTSSATADPIASQSDAVWIYDATGAVVSRCATDASGNYSTSTGLPSGTYYARTGTSFIDELYDNLPWELGAQNPLLGTPIAVAAPAVTTGIDFALDPPGGGGSAELSAAWSNVKKKGSKVTARLTVNNTGIAAGQFTVKFYVVKKAPVLASAAAAAKPFLTRTISSLAQSGSAALRIKTRFTNSRRYLKAVVDATGTVAESNENNNVATAKIQ